MKTEPASLISFLQCRPEVKAFAVLMEHKLRENDAKKGGRDNWLRCPPHVLAELLWREVGELHRAQLQQHAHRWQDVPPFGARPGPSFTRLFEGREQYSLLHDYQVSRRPDLVMATALEAADVANFAMMLADVCGGICVPVEVA